MPRKRSRTKENGENVLSKKLKTDHTEEEMFDEDCFKPIEKDGEAVLAIECGSNKAHMYLSKLYQGSKGSCVSFQGSWLTPNEFQYVSGRESAKDWKRSIRHQGLSLKIFFTRGILSVRKLCENEENTTLTGQQSPSTRNQSDVTDTTKQTRSLHSRKANKQGKRRHGITEKATVKAAALGVPDVAASDAKKSDDGCSKDTEQVLDAKQDQENTSEMEAKIDETDTLSTGSVVRESLLETASNEMKELEGNTDGGMVEQTQEQTTEDSLKETKCEKETTDDKTDRNCICEGEDGIKNSAMPVLHKEEVITRDEISKLDSDIKSVDLGSPRHMRDERINPPNLDYCSNAIVADEAENSRVQTNLTNSSPECTNTSVGILHNNTILPKYPESFDLHTVNQWSSSCDCSTSSVQQRSAHYKMESPRATDMIHSSSIRPSVADIDEKTYIPKKLMQSVMPNVHKSIDVKAEATVKAAALNSLISSLHRSAAKQPQYSVKELENQHCSGNNLRQSHDSIKSIHIITGPDVSNIHDQDKSRSLSFTNSKMHSPSLEQHNKTTTNKGIRHPNQNAVDYPNITKTNQSEKPRNKSDAKRHPTKSGAGIPHKSKGRTFAKPNLDQGLREYQNGVYLPDYHILHSKMQKDYAEYMTLLASAYRQPFPFIPLPVTSPSLPEVYSYSKLQENRVQSPTPLPKGLSPVQPIPSYPLDFSQFYNPFPVGSPKLPSEILPFSTVHPVLPNSKQVKISKVTKQIQKSAKSEHIESNMALDLSKKNTPQSDGTEKYLDYSKPLDFSRKGDKLNENEKMDFKWNTDESYLQKRHRSANVSNSWIEKSDPVPKASYEASCKCDAECSDDIQKWTVDQVCSFLSKLEGCSMYTKTFREQGITGHLLPFLTTEQLTRCLGMKMGPALFFVQAVERKLRESRSSLSYKLGNGKVGVDVQM